MPEQSSEDKVINIMCLSSNKNQVSNNFETFREGVQNTLLSLKNLSIVIFF